MLHGFSRSDSSVLVVNQHLPQKVESVLCDSRVIVHVDEALKWDLVRVFNQFHELFWHVQLVLLHIFLKIGAAHDVYNFHELVIVVSALEERIYLEMNTASMNPTANM